MQAFVCLYSAIERDNKNIDKQRNHSSSILETAEWRMQECMDKISKAIHDGTYVTWQNLADEFACPHIQDYGQKPNRGQELKGLL